MSRGIRCGEVILIVVMSASFPTSSDPRSASRPIARAASIVIIERSFPAGRMKGSFAADCCKSAVSRAARKRSNGMAGAVPSVVTATLAPSSMSSGTGHRICS